MEVDARHRLVAFMRDYATYLMNRHIKGDESKVAYERARGKKPKTLGWEFGEKLLYKKRGPKLEKIKVQW